MDFSKYTREELLDLYEQAVDAYEGNDEPIMSDEEYDELVGYLQLENKAEIGSKSKSKAYTIPHSLLMGSLDKVHVKYNEESGEYNYGEVADVINRHLNKSNHWKPYYIECTPKYDGCSFSIELSPVNNTYSDFNMTVATRGDGKFGADISRQMMANDKMNTAIKHLKSVIGPLFNTLDEVLIIRGEVLVDKNVYAEKYKDMYKNTRVFVSGVLNNKFSDEFKQMYNDLVYVCYDFRLFKKNQNDYRELSWNNFNDSLYTFQIKDFCTISDNSLIINKSELTADDFEMIYKKYEQYRKDCLYQLDGIVIKPNCVNRLLNTDRVRPADMIAVKFVAEKMLSKIVDVEWNVGMTLECYPVAIIEPVYQDGKEITRASLHGYSYMLNNKAGIGSRVEIVMNGDIVPGIKSVLSEGELKMPEFETYVMSKTDNKTVHLMKTVTDAEKRRYDFICSAKALIIDGIAEKTAERMYDALFDEFEAMFDDKLFNLMQLMSGTKKMSDYIVRKLGDSKSTTNILNSLENYRKNITLTDIIRGLCINGCGEKSSLQCARYMSGLTYDFSGLSSESYGWCVNENSNEHIIVESLMSLFDYPYLKEDVTESTEKIPIIMTGDPSKCTDYATKSKWLAAHPQYTETTKWSEAKILFTNDIESKTGKMRKAIKNNVEIRLYVQ